MSASSKTTAAAKTVLQKVAETSGTKTFKKPLEVLPRPRAHWVGNGFNVFPVFAHYAFTKHVSPFLMFDYAAPKYFKPSDRRRGVGQHPHRGFETITIAFQGEVQHEDSTGNSGIIGEGDIQWMTAGRGIIHEEWQSTRFQKKGGTLEMCQLWLNLPAKYKMTKPRYQPILKKQIPTVYMTGKLTQAAAAKKKTSQSSSQEEKQESKLAAAESPNGNVRVIAGTFRGTKGPAKTFTPVDIFDVNLTRANVTFDIDLKKGHNTIVFVRRGNIVLNGKDRLGPQQVARMGTEGETIQVSGITSDSQLLILSGEPIDEPIANMGPFCMNTQQELRQAVLDYQSGKMGK